MYIVTEENKQKCLKLWEVLKKMIGNLTSKATVNLVYPQGRYPELVIQSNSDKEYRKIFDLLRNQLKELPLNIHDTHKANGRLQLGLKDDKVHDFLSTYKPEETIAPASPAPASATTSVVLGFQSLVNLITKCGGRRPKHFLSIDYNEKKGIATVYHQTGQSTQPIIDFATTLGLRPDFGRTEYAIKIVVDEKVDYNTFYTEGLEQYFPPEVAPTSVASAPTATGNADAVVDSLGTLFKQLNAKQKQLFQQLYLPDTVIDIKELTLKIRGEERERFTKLIGNHLKNGYVLINTNKPIEFQKKKGGLHIVTADLAEILN